MGLLDLGLVGLVVFIIVILILLPIVATILVGIGFANALGFTGLTWWAFVILFYLIISAILGACVRKNGY